MTSANDRQVGGDHYRKHGAELQHWDLVAMFQWDYFQGQVIKYLMRWRDKNGVQDLEKAAHYLQKYIETETTALASAALRENSDSFIIPSRVIPVVYGKVRLDGLLPVEVISSAEFLVRWFKNQNIEHWEIAGCSSLQEQYANAGEVKPDGWIGYTFEGADAKGFHFRCTRCRTRFWVKPEGNPNRSHDNKACEKFEPLGDDEPTWAYVAQAADPARPPAAT